MKMIKSYLERVFDTRNGPMIFYLRLNLNFNTYVSIKINQASYTKNILSMFNMDYCRYAATLADVNTVTEPGADVKLS